MNFLAHFWLADQAGADLAGALLGDYWRGALPAEMPPALAQSVRLHRRVDALTDCHPRVQAVRAAFAPGTRRYAGILLDVLYDHALASAWPRYGAEPLADFARRCTQAVGREAHWFGRAGGPVPQPGPLVALLLSYRDESGVDSALHRTAQRLRRPQGLLDAARGWRAHLPRLQTDLPVLLRDLREAATAFMSSPPVAR